MPVPSSLDDLSTNPAENYPAGTESVFPSLDDYLRTAFAFIAQLREGPILLSAIPDNWLPASKLAQIIRNGLAQPGDFKWRCTEDPGAGWLICNGAAYSRTEYAALFAAIGTRFGSGNGTTTFNVPDLRAQFIRGADLGRGVDPGRWVGHWQNHMFESHNHTGETDVQGQHAHLVTPPWSPDQNGGGRTASGASNSPHEPIASYWTDEGGAHRHWFSTSWTGGHETRPQNVALLPCIYAGV